MWGRGVWVAGLAAVSLLFVIGPAEGATGALDPSFDGSGEVTTLFPFNAGARALALQPDGKIVAAGVSEQASGFSEFTLVRYQPTGSLDSSFGSGGIVQTPLAGTGDDYINAVALQGDGKIVVAGTSTIPTEVFTLARYNPNGSLDTTFGSGGIVTTPVGASDSYLYAIALQPDGRIVAVGGSSGGFSLVRYNANGSLDTGFGSGGTVLTPIGTSADAIAVALQEDGKIVGAGISFNGSQNVFALARYNSNGSLDTSFGSGGIVSTPVGSAAAARSLLLQTDGKIVAIGDGYSGATDEFALARYNSNGSLDTGFGSGGIVMTPIGGGSSEAHQGTLQPDGKILAAGTSTTSDGLTGRFGLVRYNPNGSLDPNFGGSGIVTTTIGSNAGASALALQPDGKVILAGNAEFGAGGTSQFALARYLGSTLTVQKQGTGAGSVTSSPAGINCGAACSAPFSAVLVTLTATPAAAGSIFTGWSGGGCSGTAACRVQVSSDQTVTATFSLAMETLTITKSGKGSGKVSATGISCGAICSHAYSYGATVTLTPSPASTSIFKGWSGACAGTGACTVTMKQAQSATATFGLKPACIVPKVKGKSLKVARQKIKRAHCRTGKVTRRYSTVKKGHVISQKPRPNRHLRSGAKVNLVTSKGRRP